MLFRIFPTKELGIVNGAQGFARKFLTLVWLTGYTYATSALIEIPKSKVQHSNPPPKYFPVELLTWNFTSSIHVDPEEPDKFTKCRVHDSQLSCEPGFASTGHSAQGKTLPKIACTLRAYSVTELSLIKSWFDEGQFGLQGTTQHD